MGGGGMLDVLDSISLDWSDVEKTHVITNELVHELASDRETLRYLLETIPERGLLEKCETHRLLDKLVIYDALERGFRIRLHFSTNDHLDRPHDHRFSFSSLILAGAYQHVRHRPTGRIDNSIAPAVQEDHQAVDTGIRVEPHFATIEEAGSFYTLHHTVIHTTVTTDNTVSLFIRGPAEKERSLITDRATGRLWWRYGETDEAPGRRLKVAMTPAHYALLKRKARSLQVV